MFGRPQLALPVTVRYESKANEIDDYRRDVNLSRDTCDTMRRKLKEEKDKEGGVRHVY